jgi:hypothetical protein
MALSPGTKLDHYEIIEEIGSGGMGEVYRARDTKLGRDIAVKALPAVFAFDSERLARFEREAQALAALNHPSIAVIHELKEVDLRDDVWAFGCVFYEMLTGRQTFPQGDTLSDTLADILAREPDWQGLPAETSPRIRSLLERCLRKDERRRWGGMADVGYEIEEASKELEAGARRPAAVLLARRRRLILNALAIIFLVITVATGLWYFLRPAPEVHALRSEYLGPHGTAIAGLSEAELSPDGRKLAFLARSEGRLMIWVRALDSTPQPLTSTEGTGTELFWSADSQFIGFSAEGKLKKVAFGGGPAQVVADLPGSAAYAGTWNADGVILIGSEAGGPLLRVPGAGGELTPATELDEERKETAHAYPSFLPDGKHYFYLARSSDPQRSSAAFVGELSSKERIELPGIASEVKYSAAPKGGYLVFIREGALMAQPFDAKRLEKTGEAFPLADAFIEAHAALGGPFSVSAAGGLAYLRPFNISGVAATTSAQFAWFDRSGKQLALAGPEGPYVFGTVADTLETLVSSEPSLSGPPGTDRGIYTPAESELWNRINRF